MDKKNNCKIKPIQ